MDVAVEGEGVGDACGAEDDDEFAVGKEGEDGDGFQGGEEGDDDVWDGVADDDAEGAHACEGDM